MTTDPWLLWNGALLGVCVIALLMDVVPPLADAIGGRDDLNREARDE